MKYKIIHDKKTIESFLIKNKNLNLYSLGDLDDFFWNYTTWFALLENNEIIEICLLYMGMKTPTIIALVNNNTKNMQKLLEEVKTFLPSRFYAHLSPNIISSFENQNKITSLGNHYKMALNLEKFNQINLEKNNNIKTLKEKDNEIIMDLLKASYPDNFYDAKMLLTKQYLGYFDEEKLVALAGIHVYSEKYHVSALGNITVHPEKRGLGIAYKITAQLCKNILRNNIKTIGLNVNKNNFIAIKCYEKIGFEIKSDYEEYLIEKD